jgi:hypothetical protein
MNLNGAVWVKLTKAGHQRLNDMVRHDDEYFTASERTGEFQMWRLMQVFGSVIYNGMPEVMFEKNEIYFSKPE